MTLLGCKFLCRWTAGLKCSLFEISVDSISRSALDLSYQLQSTTFKNRNVQSAIKLEKRLPVQVDTTAVLAIGCREGHPTVRPRDVDNGQIASCRQSL